MTGKPDAIVIGAGAIGVCSAYYLAERGLTVTLVDRDDVCAGCSYGNAGLLVPSHSVPLASPGVIWQALRWMFKPDSPFYIRPRLSPELISWLWKFRAACNADHVARAMPVIRDLTVKSIGLFEDLAEVCDTDFGFEKMGVMYIYDTDEALRYGVEEAEHLRVVGLEAEPLDRSAVLAKLEGVQTTAIGGVFHPYDGHLTPYK